MTAARLQGPAAPSTYPFPDGGCQNVFQNILPGDTGWLTATARVVPAGAGVNDRVRPVATDAASEMGVTSGGLASAGGLALKVFPMFASVALTRTYICWPVKITV